MNPQFLFATLIVFAIALAMNFLIDLTSNHRERKVFNLKGYRLFRWLSHFVHRKIRRPYYAANPILIRPQFRNAVLGLLVTAAVVCFAYGEFAAGGTLICPAAVGAPTDELTKGIGEIKTGIGEIQKENADIKKTAGEHATALADVKKENEALKLSLEKQEKEFNTVRKLVADRRVRNLTAPTRGMVSDECAEHLGATFVLMCAKAGKLELLSQSSGTRDAMLNTSRQILGLEQKAALTASDIPLPSVYSGELRALIANFGVVRANMFPYPIGMGTAKPPRMGTRPQFASIALSGAFGELSPTITFASLESHKIGGIVRVPREIEEQSIVPMGQFLARYGAVEFARAEDTWGLLADGSGTYEQVKGVVQICADNNTAGTPTLLTLGATKTAPSDVALADIRQVRLGVKTPVLSSGSYYFNATWEQRLRTFNTVNQPNVYVQVGPQGRSTLDGYPIIWTEVLAPYGTAANASAAVCIFGDLSYWWMGEHLTPRIDTSDQVYFVNDQLGVRFIEEIDFDYMDIQAAAALKLAAA